MKDFPTKRAVVYLMLEVIRNLVFVGGIIWSVVYTHDLILQVSAPEDKLLVFLTIALGYIIIVGLYLLTGMPFAQWCKKMKEMINV